MLKKQYQLIIELIPAVGTSKQKCITLLEKEPTEREIEEFIDETLESERVELNGEILFPIIKKAYVETFYTKAYSNDTENQTRIEALNLNEVRAGVTIEYIGETSAFEGEYTALSVESIYENPEDCPEKDQGKLIIVKFTNDYTPEFFRIDELALEEWRLVKLNLNEIKEGVTIEYIGQGSEFKDYYDVVSAEAIYENLGNCPEKDRGKFFIIKFINEYTPMFFRVDKLQLDEWKILR